MAVTPFRSKFLASPIGVNNTVADDTIGDEEWSDAANYQPDILGGNVTKREGISTVSSAVSGTVSSIYQGRNANYFTHSTKLCSFAGTELLTGLTAGYPSWTTFATYDIFVNGTNKYKTANGSTFTALSGCPTGAKYICQVNNFLYAAGHSAGLLRWANIGTAETWPTSNQLVLTQDANDDITGLAGTKNALLVTHAKSFRLITGYTSINQQVSYYSREEGCVSHRSIVVCPFGLFWWTSHGMVWVQDQFKLDYPMLRKLQTTLSSLNASRFQYVHGCYDPVKMRVMYWVSVGSSEDLRIDYYPIADAFFLHTGTGVQMGASGVATVSGAESVYCGGIYSSPTYLYKVDGSVATDNGTAISSYLETKRESSDGPTTQKMGRKVTLSTNNGSSATMTYSCYVDNETAVASGNSWSLSLGTGGVDTTIGINRTHYKLKHRISDSATSRTRITGLVHDGYLIRSK